MLLVPSSVLDLHDLNALARNLCAKPLRVRTMQFMDILLMLERVQNSGCIDRRPYSPTHGGVTTNDKVLVVFSVSS